MSDLAHVTINLDRMDGTDNVRRGYVVFDPRVDVPHAPTHIHVETVTVFLDNTGRGATDLVGGVAYAVSSNRLRGVYTIAPLTAGTTVDLSQVITAGAPLTPSEGAALAARITAIEAAPTAHTHPASQVSDSTPVGRSLLTAADAAAARTTLGLGSVATTAATDYATAAQGVKADTASQPGHTHPVAQRGLKLRRTATLALPTAGVAQIPWDTEDLDTDGYHADGSASITIPPGLGGVYALTLTVTRVAGTLTGRSFLQIAGGRGPLVAGEDIHALTRVVNVPAGTSLKAEAYTSASGVTITAALEALPPPGISAMTYLAMATLGTVTPATRAKCLELLTHLQKANGATLRTVWGYSVDPANTEHHTGRALDLMTFTALAHHLKESTP